MSSHTGERYMRALTSRSVVGSALLALMACTDGSFAPTVETVAGTYAADVFTLTSSAGTSDLLASGAEVSAVLKSDGTTTGRLFVPGGGENGENLDEDLAGTWSLLNGKVTFDQAADTFIRDAAFIATRDRLTTDGTFGEETILLVLTKAN
ncbi:MAG: hypothetical protein ACREOQ_14480 [Gemmatimonadales bacterium]